MDETRKMFLKKLFVEIKGYGMVILCIVFVAVSALVIIGIIPSIIGVVYYNTQIKELETYPIEEYQELENLAYDIFSNGKSYLPNFDENGYTYNITMTSENDVLKATLTKTYDNTTKNPNFDFPQIEVIATLSDKGEIVTQYYTENEYSKYIKGLVLSNTMQVIWMGILIEALILLLAVIIITGILEYKSLNETQKICMKRIKEHP